MVTAIFKNFLKVSGQSFELVWSNFQIPSSLGEFYLARVMSVFYGLIILTSHISGKSHTKMPKTLESTI